MRRLFLKIFAWFWATVILTGISLVLAFVLQPQGIPSRWHASLADTVRYFGTAAIGSLEQGGVPAASKYLDQLLRDAHIHACIFNGTGEPLVGTYCPEFAGMAAKIAKGE